MPRRGPPRAMPGRETKRGSVGNQQTRVGVLFGGPSAEHEVSAASALAIVRGLRGRQFRPIPIGIGRDGRWMLLSADAVAAALASAPDGPAIQHGLVAAGTEVELRRGGSLVPAAAPGAVLEQLDVVFPALHGPYGEDGVLQGHLEALDVPYAGAGVLASAVGMDKVAMRRAFTAEGIPVPPGTWFSQRRWQDHGARLADRLCWPLFVKPANMGSSVGVSRVTSPAGLAGAVDEAFRYDDVVLIEQGITGRELLCGVIGDADQAEASLPSELKVDDGFPDYAHKYYLSEGITGTSPADLPDDVTARVREMSLRAFRAIGGYGLARVDFLYDQAADLLYAGEINTMPGFTARSFFARGWAASGLPYERLLDRLIDLALGRHARQRDRAGRCESAREAVR
jgi:D-alanine-D-alanine ligase